MIVGILYWTMLSVKPKEMANPALKNILPKRTRNFFWMKSDDLTKTRKSRISFLMGLRLTLKNVMKLSMLSIQTQKFQMMCLSFLNVEFSRKELIQGRLIWLFLLTKRILFLKLSRLLGALSERRNQEIKKELFLSQLLWAARNFWKVKREKIVIASSEKKFAKKKITIVFWMYLLA